MTGRVWHSSELHGLRGENGEEWCVFWNNAVDPLNSFWIWRKTEQEAREWSQIEMTVVGARPADRRYAEINTITGPRP